MAVADTPIRRDLDRKAGLRGERLANARHFARLYRRVFGEPAPEAFWLGVAMLNGFERIGKLDDIDVGQDAPTSRGRRDHAGYGG